MHTAPRHALQRRSIIVTHDTQRWRGTEAALGGEVRGAELIPGSSLEGDCGEQRGGELDVPVVEPLARVGHHHHCKHDTNDEVSGVISRCTDGSTKGEVCTWPGIWSICDVERPIRFKCAAVDVKRCPTPT